MQIIEESDEFQKVDKEEITTILMKTQPINIEHTGDNKVIPMQEFALVKEQHQPTAVQTLTRTSKHYKTQGNL